MLFFPLMFPESSLRDDTVAEYVIPRLPIPKAFELCERNPRLVMFLPQSSRRLLFARYMRQAWNGYGAVQLEAFEEAATATTLYAMGPITRDSLTLYVAGPTLDLAALRSTLTSTRPCSLHELVTAPAEALTAPPSSSVANKLLRSRMPGHQRIMTSSSDTGVVSKTRIARFKSKAAQGYLEELYAAHLTKQVVSAEPVERLFVPADLDLSSPSYRDWKRTATMLLEDPTLPVLATL